MQNLFTSKISFITIFLEIKGLGSVNRSSDVWYKKSQTLIDCTTSILFISHILGLQKWGFWCFGCLRAHRGLPVGFLLLRYSVLFNVESLSLLYLLVISWFTCSSKWCIDKLGVLCVFIHIWIKGEVGVPWNLFKPSSKIFYWPFQGGTSFVDLLCFFCLVVAMPLCVSVYMCLVVTYWDRADLLALVCGVLLWVCHFPTGILGQMWYLIDWFLIVAPLLTLHAFQLVKHTKRKKAGIYLGGYQT